VKCMPTFQFFKKGKKVCTSDLHEKSHGECAINEETIKATYPFTL
jgi:hypothetical protein